MSTSDLLYEQYRQVNVYLKRIINEEEDYQDIKFYTEEIIHKINYISKLKKRLIEQKKGEKKNERI